MKSINLLDYTPVAVEHHTDPDGELLGSLLGSAGAVHAIEFSNDGSLLASGGDRGQVFIWKMEQVLDSTCTASPLKVAHKDFSACSLAISADNSRIFAGGPGRPQGIFVFDTNM